MNNVSSFMIEDISKEIVMLLMEERGMTMREALRTLYNSNTYTRLNNTRNGMYTQSTAYIYEYLEKEQLAQEQAGLGM